jgi:hypothetical protein
MVTAGLAGSNGQRLTRVTSAPDKSGEVGSSASHIAIVRENSTKQRVDGQLLSEPNQWIALRNSFAVVDVIVGKLEPQSVVTT